MAKMRSGTIPIGETEAELRVGECPGADDGGRADGKNADAESTSVNTNPAEHTPVEQRVIDEYRNSAGCRTRRFRAKSRAEPGGKERYTLNPVSEPRRCR